MNSANNTIRQADVSGAYGLPAIIATGYGGYLLYLDGVSSANGLILCIGGLVGLCAGSLATNITPPPSKLSFLMSLATALAYLFALYIFLVVGCLAFGLAISEQSGWGTIALSLISMLLGWRMLWALGAASRARRFRNA